MLLHYGCDLIKSTTYDLSFFFTFGLFWGEGQAPLAIEACSFFWLAILHFYSPYTVTCKVVYHRFSYDGVGIGLVAVVFCSVIVIFPSTIFSSVFSQPKFLTRFISLSISSDVGNSAIIYTPFFGIYYLFNSALMRSKHLLHTLSIFITFISSGPAHVSQAT